MVDKNCNDCKYDLTKSCRYPCSECHYIFLDKFTPKGTPDKETIIKKLKEKIEELEFDLKDYMMGDL